MSVTTSTFTSTDLDEACHLMEAAYPDSGLTISAKDATDGLRLAVTRLDAGHVHADVYDNSLTLGYRATLPDFVCLSRITSGTIDFDPGRHPSDGSVLAGPGDLLVTVAGQEYRATADAAGVKAITIDLDLLSDVSGESVVALQGRLGNHLVDPTRARGWSATAGQVVEAMLDAVDEPHADLLTAGANRVLAAALLSTVLPDAEATVSEHAHPHTLRRAIAFIESNPDLPLLTSDIARAALVSTRSLRQTFRRHLDTTPGDYLRRVRLDQVRNELLDATADETTVAGAARRWGFNDLCRFSRRYHRTYDESPATTLRR